MSKLKYIISVFALFMAFAFGVTSNTNAQAPSSTPIPTVCRAFEQAAEEAADLAKRTAIERDGYKAQLELANEKLALRDEQLKNKDEQIGFWKSAYEKGTKIDTNSSMVIDNLRVQLNDFKIENADLRRENDKLRSSRDFRTWLGTGVGFGLGYYVGNKHN